MFSGGVLQFLTEERLRIRQPAFRGCVERVLCLGVRALCRFFRVDDVLEDVFLEEFRIVVLLETKSLLVRSNEVVIQDVDRVLLSSVSVELFL